VLESLVECQDLRASPPIPPALLLLSPPARTFGSDVAQAVVIVWVAAVGGDVAVVGGIVGVIGGL